MKKTKSEENISKINSNVFFKEFTFSKNDFKDFENKSELEFADNVVWLDELCFIFQIKEMDENSTNYSNWFKSKVMNKAVRQIKNTLNYLQEFSEIVIENEKGHKLDIKEAQKCEDIKRIIVYSSNEDFPEDLRRKKFYESSEIGLIHLFHIEDYYWICTYLITPAEINEYLDFREDFQFYQNNAIDKLPEQYLLGHFFETPNADHFNSKYVTNLKDQYSQKDEFDISGIIENFNKSIKNNLSQTEYYPIIKEISKLNRSELYEFKQRLSLAVEKCEKFEFITPYKIYVPRTDCAFVFIPLHSSNSHNAKTAVNNLTFANKYDNKARKSIGIVLYKEKSNLKSFEMYWQFINEDWFYDAEMEKLLKENYPFRTSKNKTVNNRYKQ